MNETINDVLRKDYDLCVKSLKKSEKKREKIEKENQRLKERIHDLLKENTEWKLENERLNNVLNEIKKIVDNYYTYDYEDENLERLNVIDEINTVVLNELKESDE